MQRSGIFTRLICRASRTLAYPPIDIKFTDRMRYYDAFDHCSEMVKLFAEYLNKRLDQYLEVLGIEKTGKL